MVRLVGLFEFKYLDDHVGWWLGIYVDSDVSFNTI